MTEAPAPEQQTDRPGIIKGARMIWLINLIFFALLFIGAILAVNYGINIVIAVTVVSFAASVLYVYLF